ncbi:MAG: hypothetical protein V1819_01685 [bacterium]
MNNPLSVKIENRIFVTDSSESNDEKYEKPLLKLFEDINTDICEGSHLLRLDPENADNQSIYKAYGIDIDYLQTKTHEFEKWVFNAVFCSIVASSSGKKAKNNISNPQKMLTMELIKTDLPRLDNNQFIMLGYQQSQKIPKELITDLQQQYKNAVNHMVRMWMMWLEKLVEAKHIGLTQWPHKDSASCLFYFFRKSQGEKTSEVEKKTTLKSVVKEEVSKTINTTSIINERHVHHLVEAKISSLSDYQKIPRFVRFFLNSTPKWIKKYLMVIDGVATMEEIDKIENIGEISEVVVNRKRSLFLPDPAVTFGPFVLTAWNSKDFKEEPHDPFPIHFVNVKLRKRLVYFLTLPLSFIFLALTILSLVYPAIPQWIIELFR